MGRAKVLLVWLLLAAEVVGLLLHTQAPGDAALAFEPGMSLRTRSVQTVDGITFYLENLTPEIQPSLTVTGRTRLDESLHYDKPGQTVTRVTLPGRTLANYPAQLLRYTWLAGEAELRGQHLYINPQFPYDWKVRQYDLFTVYHVGTLPAGQVETWAEIYRWLADLLLQRPYSQAIYLMPRTGDLPKALRLTRQDDLRLAGLWVEPAESILLAPVPESTQTTTVTHELSHALLYNGNPIWWEEGIATWITQKEGKHRTGMARSPEWKAIEVGLQALHRMAREAEVSLSQVDSRQTYPLDRYTVGSSFVLYVRSRIGDPGVLLLASAAAGRPLEEALPEILGESMAEAELRWLAYIRSPRFLEDAENP